MVKMMKRLDNTKLQNIDLCCFVKNSLPLIIFLCLSNSNSYHHHVYKNEINHANTLRRGSNWSFLLFNKNIYIYLRGTSMQTQATQLLTQLSSSARPTFITWLSPRNFFRGESIVMQISFVMLLFSDQISGRGKSFQGGKLPQGGAPCPPPPWKKARLFRCKCSRRGFGFLLYHIMTPSC